MSKTSKSRDSDLLDEIKVNRVSSVSYQRNDSKKSPLEPTNESSSPHLRLRSNTGDWWNVYNQNKLRRKRGTRVRHGRHRLLTEEDEDFRTRSLSESDVLSRIRPPFVDGEKAENILYSGWLYKTIRPKSLGSVERSRRERRHHRRFQLTDHSLRYLQPFQRTKVSKHFPLTSILEVTDDPFQNPVMFKLVFQNAEMLLEAPDSNSCKLWVKTIKRAWNMWNVPKSPVHSPYTPPERLEGKLIEEGIGGSHLEELQGHWEQIEAAGDFLEAPKDRTIARGRINTSSFIKSKLGLVPRLVRPNWKAFQEKLKASVDDFTGLCNDFVMIKYPRKGKSLPHDRVFTIDPAYLQVMWRETQDSKFTSSRTITTDSIVEIRDKQRTDGFDRYPFEEIEDQSFSVIVEGEKIAGPSRKKYAVLKPLDLICDSYQEQQLWCRALKSFVTPKCCMFNSRYQYTDPLILWLKSQWILLATDGFEIKEDAALSFGKKLSPQLQWDYVNSNLDLANSYQINETKHHGSSLCWDGFILFYNLLCGIYQQDCALLEIFKEYVKEHPRLGMTVREFQNFLIKYQEWLPEDATEETCEHIMISYDYHHRAFKMYMAERNPEKFRSSYNFLSFAGFLSFLRSYENTAVKKEHETVYQDMTQPLSHYFINSSHNTYLEGHQLTGRSTTDAYVRALLQGCRCLELDCWDGPDDWPKVTHGNTLVSDLSLVEVAEIINEYAFQSSPYPLILSLENHCCRDQQNKMAEIFQSIFGDKLVKENLVEKYNLTRLPSPQELQGKILLKGREKFTKHKPTSPSTAMGQFAKSASQSSLADLSTSEGSISDKEEEIPMQEELYEDLSKMIVYCRTKHIKPWSWKEQKKTSICNMFSFSESMAYDKCNKYSKELLACTERQLVRAYPAGKRTDSSNYNPIPMWNNGIHMTALNIQTPDGPMYLNQGKFRQNGGCGYILKPEVMRNPNEKEYTPTMTKPHPAVIPVQLEITLLSGQHFIFAKNKRNITVEVFCQTCGIPHDCEGIRYVTSNNHTDLLWPQFQLDKQLTKTILMPELCLVLFSVTLHIQRRFRAGSSTTILGQNVIPLTSLRPGLRYIPLRTIGGQCISHVGIFVKIKMTAVNSWDNSLKPRETASEHKVDNCEEVINNPKPQVHHFTKAEVHAH
ncbi:1-phosphatidylinositol 4,5-bisphosphate phosphodiesterase delta-1-like isoform X2 [Dysidea avara]|uniref:1-phosphatidylinositol 4,5-bisphosphate phosphodiesterase delta-1-like isoform X2 n=1 Tax=Dysidea avara TaxID=196820 RepID=UPI003328874E